MKVSTESILENLRVSTNTLQVNFERHSAPKNAKNMPPYRLRVSFCCRAFTCFTLELGFHVQFINREQSVKLPERTLRNL